MSAKTKLLLTAVDKTKRAFQSAGKNVSTLQKSVVNAQRAFSALIAGAVVKNIAEAGLAMDRFRRAFKVGTGSIESANREMQFVIDTSLKLGTNLESSAAAYSKLTAASQGTALQGRETRQIFTAVSKAAVVLGLTADQTNNALVAFEQIISKGKVSAEELRRQLSNVLPGSFQIAARSIGVTTAELDKMLKAGQLTAQELLPALSRELIKTFDPAVEDAANSAQASFARLQTSLFLLKNEIAEGGLLPALASLADHLRVLLPGADSGFGKISDKIGERIEELKSERRLLEAQISSLEADPGRNGGGGFLGQLVRNAKGIGTAEESLAKYRAEVIKVREELDRLIQKQLGVLTGDEQLEPINLNAARANIAKTRAEYDKFLQDLEKNSRRAFDSLIKRFETAETKTKRMRRALVRYKDELDPAEFKRILSEINFIPEIEIDFEGMRRDFDEKMQDMRRTAETEFDGISQASIQAARSIQRAFAQFLFDPFEDGVKGMVKGFLDAIRRMIANEAAVQLIGFVKKIFGSIGGGGGIKGGGSKVPGKADGGPVSAGGSFIVGERGPELFIPRQSGSIVPNNKMGGGSVIVNQNYNIEAGVDSATLERTLPPLFEQNRLQTIAEIQRMRFVGEF